MTNTVEKRIEALEAHLCGKEPITIIRIITLAEDKNAEPARADVRGESLEREDHETVEAFLARVEAVARLAALPGRIGTALVWPEMESGDGD
ncbi:hypothetical protein [Ideonella sp. A 288]|uniref:hypothetical protein n=1 Tax=Ideonella sp. A 288 TaxID=1962181 RepID=UPI000B4B0D13|nr:hypothetical protein [Ideonella sp. A 288]